MKSIFKLNSLNFLLIILVIMLTTYSTIVNVKYPLIGLDVKEQQNQWFVNTIYSKGWAKDQSINVGDRILKVNEKDPAEHSTIYWFNRVEKAETLTIEKADGNVEQYTITYEMLDFQYILYLILPLLFSFTTIFLSIFLFSKKKEEQSAMILIYFLLSLGVCYLSASTSAKGDILGRVLTFVTLPGSLLLFIHFLQSFFKKNHLTFIHGKVLGLLYVLYVIFLLSCGTSYFIFGTNYALNNILLIFFALLLICLLFYLGKLYYKKENKEGTSIIKILLFAFVHALSPFLVFYALPTVIIGNGKEFLSAEFTAIFLIIIPIAIVYLQIADKLFDIDFLLNRLRFYSLLSLPFTVYMSLMVKFIFDIYPFSTFLLLFSILLFGSTLVFLYLKEYLDYKISRHLFSQKSNFNSSLYKFFQKAQHETKVESLINHLIQEIKDVLVVKDTFYLEVTSVENNKWKIKNDKTQYARQISELEKINWEYYRVGSLLELKSGYVIIIGEELEKKRIIFIGLKKFTPNFNIQESIWIETLAYISSILLENFQLIEDLFYKIEYYKEKQSNNNYPSWLSRLLFTLSEKERANLSTDLHDSVLQDLLQLLREIENIAEKIEAEPIKYDLYYIKERVLDNIHLVRETCNELRPPFLKELGFFESIQHLFKLTKLRSNFILYSEVDPNLEIKEPGHDLIIYRVVQELLNNAMKHSQASIVKIALTQQDHSLTIAYEDNGIGMDMSKLNDSFKTIGVSGIKERVKSIGGTIEIYSRPKSGMNVFIEIDTGSDVND